MEDRSEGSLGSYYSYELYSHQLIQITSSEAIILEEKYNDFPRRCYHIYEDNGIDMREYHVDTHPFLRDMIKPGIHQYSGNLGVSLEKVSRPIMIIGQEKSTFQQFVFSNKYRKCPQGRNLVQPRGAGDILM